MGLNLADLGSISEQSDMTNFWSWNMEDKTFGWTVEMQVKAAKARA